MILSISTFCWLYLQIFQYLMWINNSMSPPRDPMPTFNLVFKYHPSRCKRAESNLLADDKNPHHLGQVVVCVFNLYLYVIRKTTQPYFNLILKWEGTLCSIRSFEGNRWYILFPVKWKIKRLRSNKLYKELTNLLLLIF